MSGVWRPLLKYTRAWDNKLRVCCGSIVFKSILEEAPGHFENKHDEDEHEGEGLTEVHPHGL